MKTALLVLVHGSPRPIANESMCRVVEEVGFMECNEPIIPDGVDACAALGMERIIAVPYFLHTGTHVADDLPTLLEEARQRHPHIEFQMGRYIGASPILTDILARRALAAQEG